MERNDFNKIAYLGLSFFINLIAYYLSYADTDYTQLSYLPLTLLVITVLLLIYHVWKLIPISKSWDSETDDDEEGEEKDEVRQDDPLQKRLTLLLVISVFAVLIGGAVYFLDDTDQTATTILYKNATTIMGVGLSGDSGNNTQFISELNNGYWIGNESTTAWQIYITFHNVTKFDYVESVHKYNSSVGTSSHIVERLVWCPVHNDWIELEEFTNENNWYVHIKPIPDSSHYIFPNGTVMLKYDHPASGNTSHRIFIDVSRLLINQVNLSHG